MKNKLMTWLISTVMFFSVFSIPLFTKHVLAASKEGIVTVGTLNIMEKSSTDSKIIGSVTKGKFVVITKELTGWSQIKYGSKTGWVSNSYIDEIGYVTTSWLNLRQSNSTSSKALTVLKKGIPVQIKSTKSSWLNVYVLSNKKTGWVSSKYISTTRTTTAKAASVSTTKYYVTAGSLNIRQSASPSSKVVATVKKGASVTYFSKSGHWAKVKTASNVSGWASMAYLSKTKPVITKTYYVTTSSLNVRSSGSVNGRVLTTLKKGDSVTYYSQSNNWAKVKTASGKIGWVSMKYLSTKKTSPSAVKTVSSSSKGLKGKVIVVDAGHGGKDPGALGYSAKEKDLTLSTAKKLQAQLEAAGAKVIMTRSGDSYPTLSDRVQITKKNHADLFISIHYNVGSSSAKGIETYYWTTYKNESKLAGLVQNEVIKSTGSINRGVKTGNFQVIRENSNLAILIELGFISNPKEEKNVKTSTFQSKAASGIVNGLQAYFESL